MSTEADERANLVRAAWAVLRRSGFDGFKVRLVMRESGLSARTFYRHFPDKDALLVAMIRDEYSGFARLLTEMTAEAGSDPEAAVSCWIREFLIGLSDPAREARARVFTAHHAVMWKHPDATAEANQLVIEPLRTAIDRGVEMGVFACTDPASDALQISRLVSGALNEVLSQRPSPPDVTDVIESTTAFALKALSVATPTQRP